MAVNFTEYLQQETNIRNAPHYSAVCNKNLSESQMTEFSHCFHTMLGVYGEEFVLKKVLDLFRVNPLLAVMTMERCVLNKYINELSINMHGLFSAAAEQNDNRVWTYPIILNERTDYLILLVETCYRNSISKVVYWDTINIFLNRLKEEDYHAHKEGLPTKFFTQNNIRHLITHIPGNRQIEFINWFWEKHCYAKKKFKQKDTYNARRVEFMMKEMAEGCLWKDIENWETTEMLPEERNRVVDEVREIIRFLQLTMGEGRHMQYIAKVLGKDDLEKKLVVLLGQDGLERYKRMMLVQKLIEKREAQRKKKAEK